MSPPRAVPRYIFHLGSPRLTALLVATGAAALLLRSTLDMRPCDVLRPEIMLIQNLVLGLMALNLLLMVRRMRRTSGIAWRYSLLQGSLFLLIVAQWFTPHFSYHSRVLLAPGESSSTATDLGAELVLEAGGETQVACLGVPGPRACEDVTLQTPAGAIVRILGWTEDGTATALSLTSSSGSETLDLGVGVPLERRIDGETLELLVRNPLYELPFELEFRSLPEEIREARLPALLIDVGTDEPIELHLKSDSGMTIHSYRVRVEDILTGEQPTLVVSVMRKWNNPLLLAGGITLVLAGSWVLLRGRRLEPQGMTLEPVPRRQPQPPVGREVGPDSAPDSPSTAASREGITTKSSTG